MGDHAHDCKMHGSYTVTTCPVCGHRITPARRYNPRHRYAVELEFELRKRPPNRLFDVDGNCDMDDT